MRQTVGENYPVHIKLNAADKMDGSLEIDDAIHAAKELALAGIDTWPAFQLKTGAELENFG